MKAKGTVKKCVDGRLLVRGDFFRRRGWEAIRRWPGVRLVLVYRVLSIKWEFDKMGISGFKTLCSRSR